MTDDNNSDKQDVSAVEMLRRIQTAESVLLPIPRDAFEKLYLSPKLPAAGNLRRTFGNPTPISLMGFLLAATPGAMQTLGWRGSGGNGGAILPVFIFFGGMVQILGGLGEWIIGNTFSCALFFTYGTFWIVQGTTQMPFFGVGTNYSATGNTIEGAKTPEYAATVGLYYVILSILTFVYLICSIRTNFCLFLALFLLQAAGAFNLALCIPIWHIFIAQMLEAVDFPFELPVGDLSTVVLGRSQRKKREAET
ncbi:uncharacterized protein N7483_011352 [Penicillium malachiteum]|uniref:uncharacterized protein n=1 Tax=Penicillium malachiteum TaxID=1324776 RepID=UPI002549B67B|nr:uncharacterized protein N7483_011352 [Penicillium malachiteum]KAJ5714171.1 hypothetical protein N7483_011352 [Penicillium malachiteum]